MRLLICTIEYTLCFQIGVNKIKLEAFKPSFFFKYRNFFCELVTYTPYQGFTAYFDPYYNQLGYLQPIVMVQLKDPTPGVLVNIQCTAWAKLIEHDTKKMRGSIHIEFLMDYIYVFFLRQIQMRIGTYLSVLLKIIGQN